MSKPKVTLTKAEAAPDAEHAAESPSAALVRKALEEVVIDDDKGRKLTLRKPGPLAQFRILEAVGGELAANQPYMQMVNPLLWLSMIDGEPVFMPKSKLEVEALITRLDDDGLAALMSWYYVNVLGPTMEAVDAAAKAAEEKARLKN